MSSFIFLMFAYHPNYLVINNIMFGALAVKQQFSFRGIPIDRSCSLCHQGPKSICHMLFHCPLAKEVWDDNHYHFFRKIFSRPLRFEYALSLALQQEEVLSCL